jgi:membrane-anchored protein YejM (alkaline phosphatase superfamily)
LLFVHFPTPHPFPIYNRRERNFNLRGPLDYFDNVALVDRTLGELRRAVERAGLWDQTAVLITADHGLRPGAWIGHLGWTRELDRLTGHESPVRVPFILKLPGQAPPAVQQPPAVIDTSFSNVLAGDLGLAVLSGAVSTPAQAAAWLNQHAGTKPDHPAAISFTKPAPNPAN